MNCMNADAQPVIVAFDGSAEAQQAARAAARLFPGRLVLVVTAWEPGLALAMASGPDPSGLGYMPADPEAIAAADEAQQAHAAAAAEAGARLARELGADAQALALQEGSHIADTVAAVAEDRDAAAIIIGSRGLGRVKSTLLGSTSQRLLRETTRPVLIVRAPA
jgi:nucleotide-binding universal stress UspA family protein